MLDRFFNWIAGFSPRHQELRSRYDQDHRLVSAYAAALREIVIATDAVTVPNGTTRKVSRIAKTAFDDAMKIVARSREQRGR